MAKVHGLPGEWARVKGTVLGLWPLFTGLFIAGFAVSAILLTGCGWGWYILAVASAAIGWSVHCGMRRVESFFIGARGEERVSNILRNLPEAYHVFNDFVAGRMHVDHVVAGPAGVFAIETKNWRGKVTIEDSCLLVDGALPSRDPVAQAKREAAAVKGALAKAGWHGEVTPIVVFASDTFDAGIAELSGIVVINSSEIARGFSTGRVVIAPTELERLAGLMEMER